MGCACENDGCSVSQQISVFKRCFVLVFGATLYNNVPKDQFHKICFVLFLISLEMDHMTFVGNRGEGWGREAGGG